MNYYRIHRALLFFILLAASITCCVHAFNENDEKKNVGTDKIKLVQELLKDSNFQTLIDLQEKHGTKIEEDDEGSWNLVWITLALVFLVGGAAIAYHYLVAEPNHKILEQIAHTNVLLSGLNNQTGTLQSSFAALDHRVTGVEDRIDRVARIAQTFLDKACPHCGRL